MRPALLLASCVTVAAASVAAAGRPNILIAVADDWSFPHASAYGATWVRTPNFDRIAREGVLFKNAYTPVAKCSASRASILTGCNPWQIGAGFTHWNYFPPEHRTYPEALADAGYVTGFTGKGWSPGVARHADGSDRNVLGRGWQTHRLNPPTGEISKVDYAANFADFLASVPDGSPWCFWYGGNEPHRADEYGSGVATGGKSLSAVPRVPGYWPDRDEVRNDMLDYAFEVEYFDTQLGRILKQLSDSGQLENTLVIVTSDNGMPFPRSKGQCYEIANHMPLAIRWPAGVPHPGRTVDDYVSFIDLASTILEAAGVDHAASGLSPTPARSLVPLLESGRHGAVDSERDHVLIGRERHDPGRPRNRGYPVRGIAKDGWLYLTNFAPDRWPSGNPETGYLDTDSSPTKSVILQSRRDHGQDEHWDLAFGLRPDTELYNLGTDPDCVDNLAGQPETADREIELRNRLLAELTAQADPRLVGPDPEIFDSYPFSNPSFNDLYEQWQRGEAPLPRWMKPTDAEPGPLSRE